jgi:hypothetical protein
MGSMPPQDAPPQTLWIIWSALLVSVLMYGAIGVYVPVVGAEMPSETVKMLTQIFALMAFTNLGLVFGLRGLFAKRLAYVAYAIVRWAMCEAVALLGLVLHFMGGSLQIMAAFCGASAFAMVLLRPSEGDREGYEEAKKE